MAEVTSEHVEAAVSEPAPHHEGAHQEGAQGNYQEYSYIQPEQQEGDQTMSVEAAAAVVAAAAAAAQNAQGEAPINSDMEMVSESSTSNPSTPIANKRCAVVDCDENTNGNRTLCARHQKRKERGEELQLKENHIFGHRKVWDSFFSPSPLHFH